MDTILSGAQPAPIADRTLVSPGTEVGAYSLVSDQQLPEIAKMNAGSNARAPEYKEADRRTAGQPVVPTPRARQGVTGHNVRYVLGFGIAGVVIAFAVIYLVYFG